MQRDSQVRACSTFLILLEFKKKLRVLLKKNISDGKEMTENIKNNRCETEFVSIEDPLNMLRTSSNETTLVSEYRMLISLHQGKEKHHFQF